MRGGRNGLLVPRTGGRGPTGVQAQGAEPDDLDMFGTTVLPDCRPLLAGPDDLTLVFQPIVDLAGATIAGYAALARFPGTSGPDVWFAAAAECGLAAELQALAIHKALAAVPDLPEHTFLTVTVSPHLLGTTPVQTAFATRSDLRGVVVELSGPADREALRRDTESLRSRGGRIALDDAYLLRKGLETGADLAACMRLGIPLGQGWVLGPPTREFASLSADVVTLLRTQEARVWLTGDPVTPIHPGSVAPIPDRRGAHS
jgi:EAL domain-containing protein (putative c-di-GMP-specific phosphodiesterase class I)